MDRNRILAAALGGFLALGGGLVACDPEDEADIREGVEQVEDAAEEAAEDVEKAVDEEIDTDGKDD